MVLFFQSGTRIIENHDDFHSTREALAAVVVLSNFEANRSSNENSRVGLVLSLSLELVPEKLFIGQYALGYELPIAS